MVANVTEHWDALHHWQLSEMLKRYPDAEATMGDGRRVGEIGPDGAGNLLTPTTVREFITRWMYHPQKYFFDRKISSPTGMLNDCHPFPEPTRSYLENPTKDGIYAPSLADSLVLSGMKNRPPKKRKFQSEDESVSSNRSRSEDTQVDEPDEKSAIESMMELAKNVL